MMYSRGWLSVVAAGLLSVVACTNPRLPQDEIADDGGGDSMAGTSGGSTSASEGMRGKGSPGEGASSRGGPGDLLERCDYVDHSACFGAMVEVCQGKGHWDVTPECVNAVTSCYPIGTQALAAVDVVKFCAAEFGGECFYANGPGCGETLCTCTAGGFPFDWSSCWHLLLLACDVNVESDCESVLAGCYPGASVEDFKQCQDQVMQDVGVECHCPMCSIHESCEDALDTCLGA